MLRSKEVVGMTVVTDDTGDEIGTVKDVIVHRIKKCVVGFLVRRPGWFHHLCVLPFSDATSFDDSMLSVETESSLLSQNKAPDAVRLLERKPLPGSALITTEGHELGRILDVTFDEDSGDLEGFDFIEGFEDVDDDGESVRPKFLPMTEDIFVGKYDVIVSEHAVERVMSDEADLDLPLTTEMSVVNDAPKAPIVETAVNQFTWPAPEVKSVERNLFRITTEGSTLNISFDEMGVPDELTIARLREQLFRMLAENPNCATVSFDVTNFKFLSSIMLGLLTSLRKRVGTVEILNPSRDSREVLRIMGFDKLFKVRDRVS